MAQQRAVRVCGSYLAARLMTNDIEAAIKASDGYADLFQSALDTAGYVIAPKEPTEAMLIAARDWSIAKYGRGVGNDGAAGCYRAMLAAASPPTQPKEKKETKPLSSSPQSKAGE